MPKQISMFAFKESQEIMHKETFERRRVVSRVQDLDNNTLIYITRSKRGKLFWCSIEVLEKAFRSI